MAMTHQIAILGGSGFVGRHLVSRLRQDGHELRVLTRDARRCAVLELPDSAIVEVRDFEQATLVAALQGCDVVINLIGILNEKGHDGDGFYAVHERLPREVLRACRPLGIGRYLHMSALGAEAGGAPSHYLRSKGAGNNAVNFESADEVAWTLIQPSVIFGPDDSLFMRFAGLLKWLPVFPLACPQARFAPVWVGDVAEVFVRCLDNSATHNQSVEVCGPEVMSLREIVGFAAEHSGRRRWIIPLPGFLSALQANVMEYLPGKPFSRDNYQSTKIDSVCNPENKALSLADLDIQPTKVHAVMPQALGKT